VASLEARTAPAWSSAAFSVALSHAERPRPIATTEAIMALLKIPFMVIPFFEIVWL